MIILDAELQLASLMIDCIHLLNLASNFWADIRYRFGMCYDFHPVDTPHTLIVLTDSSVIVLLKS